MPLVALTLAAACAPLAVYYRDGVSVARLDTDTTQCKVAALRDAPVALRRRTNPPVYVSGGVICNSKGVCFESPGRWVSNGFHTVDVNAPLRGKVADLCMSRRGYRPVSIPICDPAVARAVPPGATNVLPKLDDVSCAIRNRDGSWQIVQAKP